MQNHALFTLLLLVSSLVTACSDSFSDSQRAGKNSPAVLVTVTAGSHWLRRIHGRDDWMLYNMPRRIQNIKNTT
ncbi:hypothetical protein [Alteromonas halophila]|nr:hypothetical protein [Alteromonas halophila]